MQYGSYCIVSYCVIYLKFRVALLLKLCFAPGPGPGSGSVPVDYTVEKLLLICIIMEALFFSCVITVLMLLIL